MDAILTMLVVVKWFANDLHYKSRGPNFYSDHILADRVKDFGTLADEFRETYYLGQKGANPPPDAQIATYAIDEYNKVCARSEGLLSRLHDALDVLVHQVEVCKKEQGTASGVHAILDDISRRALTYRFLVGSQMGA